MAHSRAILMIGLRKTCSHFAILVLMLFLKNGAFADDFPNFVGQRETSSFQENAVADGLKFVAALDEPPFSFVDNTTKLSGFSVFLARAICEELNLSGNCIISGLLSESLLAQKSFAGDSIYISHSGTRSFSYDMFRFSRPFLKIPGRFVARKDSLQAADFSGGLPNARIGTVAKSSEEKLLRSYFPKAAIFGFSSQTLLLNELATGQIDLAFGNGLEAADWLATPRGRECCGFAGAPYYSTHFLGEGVRFAVPLESSFLVPHIDAALLSLQRKGKIEELYLRFFPTNFF